VYKPRWIADGFETWSTLLKLEENKIKQDEQDLQDKILKALREFSLAKGTGVEPKSELHNPKSAIPVSTS
jgi:hypothetical protein